MKFAWTPHRFSGGTLAFDLANTVILRHDPARRLDRISGPEDLAGFSVAASLHCAEARQDMAYAPCPASALQPLLELRELIDRHFRSLAVSGESNFATFVAMADKAASILRQTGMTPQRIDGAVSLSALSLAMETMNSASKALRVKLCANCGWLIVDTSRNRSRIWCDMTVCGNREKSRRHYNRKTGSPEA